MEPVSRDKVLQIVRLRGPLLPNDLKKVLGGDTMLLGAILSELAGKGLVKISKTKLGGSPFYYDPANPASLERISQHLSEKDRRTYQLLKERRVLRDDQQEALIRVSLRNIKDFAIPLRVQAKNEQLLFWKHHMVADKEAEALIREALGINSPTSESKKREEERERRETEREKPGKRGEEEAEQKSGTEIKKEEKKEKAEKEENHSPAEREKKESSAARGQAPTKEEQKSLAAPGELDDPFYKLVKEYFDRQGITVKEQKVVRKRSELDLIILLPTPVGKVEYYCKAKAKKRSNEGDLASAKLLGQSKNLPTLYLTTGEITKKAKEKLTTELKGVVVKEL